MSICLIEGCDGGVFSRGWCTKHYYRWKRTGDPHVTTRTPPASATATMKFCPKCERTRPVDEFGKRKSGSLKGWCSVCTKAYDKAYAASDVGREARRKASYKWSKENREYQLRVRYGIGVVDYDALVAAQGNRCAICGASEPTGNHIFWSVDHCHDSNRVRGLLCSNCNFGLGSFKDDPALLRVAADYLET